VHLRRDIFIHCSYKFIDKCANERIVNTGQSYGYEQEQTGTLFDSQCTPEK